MNAFMKKVADNRAEANGIMTEALEKAQNRAKEAMAKGDIKKPFFETKAGHFADMAIITAVSTLLGLGVYHGIRHAVFSQQPEAS